DGSIRASTWPLVTRSLKSTSTWVTWPEIWLPTVTVEVALSVPVAEIATRMSPRSTATVRHADSAPSLRAPRHHANAAAATATTATAATRARGNGRLLRRGGAWRMLGDPGTWGIWTGERPGRPEGGRRRPRPSAAPAAGGGADRRVAAGPRPG